jgi:hypothetical protein
VALGQGRFRIGLQARAQLVEAGTEVVARLACQRAQCLHVQDNGFLHGHEVVIGCIAPGVGGARHFVGAGGQVGLFALVSIAIAPRQFRVPAQAGRCIGKGAHFGEADLGSAGATAQQPAQQQANEQEQVAHGHDSLSSHQEMVPDQAILANFPAALFLSGS